MSQFRNVRVNELIEGCYYLRLRNSPNQQAYIFLGMDKERREEDIHVFFNLRRKKKEFYIYRDRNFVTNFSEALNNEIESI